MSVPSISQLDMKKLFVSIVLGAGNPIDYGRTTVSVLTTKYIFRKDVDQYNKSLIISPNNPTSNRPNGTAPHTMTEFYAYNADAAPSPPPPPRPFQYYHLKVGSPKSFTSDTMQTMA